MKNFIRSHLLILAFFCFSVAHGEAYYPPVLGTIITVTHLLHRYTLRYEGQAGTQEAATSLCSAPWRLPTAREHLLLVQRGHKLIPSPDLNNIQQSLLWIRSGRHARINIVLESQNPYFHDEEFLSVSALQDQLKLMLPSQNVALREAFNDLLENFGGLEVYCIMRETFTDQSLMTPTPPLREAPRNQPGRIAPRRPRTPSVEDFQPRFRRRLTFEG